jgi:hypothetical protein
MTVVSARRDDGGHECRKCRRTRAQEPGFPTHVPSISTGILSATGRGDIADLVVGWRSGTLGRGDTRIRVSIG